jgi:hypothetical protein
LQKATQFATSSTVKEIDTALKNLNNTFYDEFLQEVKLRSTKPIL